MRPAVQHLPAFAPLSQHALAHVVADYVKILSIIRGLIEIFGFEEIKRVELIRVKGLENYMSICAVICGGDTWVAIETYGKAKKNWLRKFLELPNGIPSYDTFARVFAALDPQQFQECFLRWIKSVATITEGEVIPIDGKQLRHSF